MNEAAAGSLVVSVLQRVTPQVPQSDSNYLKK